MKTNGRQYEIDIAEYCNGTLKTASQDVLSAYTNILSKFGSVDGIKHSSKESWKGTGVREPKADLLFEDKIDGISVKKEGAVQLASGGINYTLLCFKECYEEIKDKLELDDTKLVLRLINCFEEFGNNKMSIDEWSSWKQTAGNSINDLMNEVWLKVPLFRETMIDEVLSGRRFYRDTPKAIAKHILTPNKIYEIDKKYVQNISSCVKIRIAAKGRSKKVNGVKQRYREAVVRFDYKT